MEFKSRHDCYLVPLKSSTHVVIKHKSVSPIKEILHILIVTPET